MKRSYPSGSDKRKRKKEEDEKRKHDSGLLRKCLVPSSSSNQEHASSSQSAATHTTTAPSTATPRFTAPSTALDSSASSSEQQSAISHTAMVNISSPTSIDQEDQTEPQAPTPAQTTSTAQEKATPIRLTSSDPGQWPDVLNDGEKSSLVKKGPLQARLSLGSGAVSVAVSLWLGRSPLLALMRLAVSAGLCRSGRSVSGRWALPAAGGLCEAGPAGAGSPGGAAGPLARMPRILARWRGRCGWRGPSWRVGWLSKVQQGDPPDQSA
uniref:Uncharacterized protein n=1 Tax=Knipowitschia caucasica TaxID=637954 RepID=A0AAV2MF77_KNICA